MSMFTIYNPETKHIVEEKFFDDFRQADKYCRESYSEGYIAKYEPFSSSFKIMLKERSHYRIKTSSSGNSIAIISEDGKSILHCGGITLQEWVNLRVAGIKTEWISKVEFIKLHNQIIDSCV